MGVASQQAVTRCDSRARIFGCCVPVHVHGRTVHAQDQSFLDMAAHVPPPVPQAKKIKSIPPRCFQIGSSLFSNHTQNSVKYACVLQSQGRIPCRTRSGPRPRFRLCRGQIKVISYSGYSGLVTTVGRVNNVDFSTFQRIHYQGPQRAQQRSCSPCHCEAKLGKHTGAGFGRVTSPYNKTVIATQSPGGDSVWSWGKPVEGPWFR